MRGTSNRGTIRATRREDAEPKCERAVLKGLGGKPGRPADSAAVAGIVGIGLDIVAVSRIGAAVRRSGERFLKKVFTPAEARYCSGRAREFEHLAARFAAKEATLKALGCGITGWTCLREVEVVRERSGRPRLLLQGGTLRRARALGVTVAHLSLSHTEEFAAAEVVLEGRSSRRG